MPLEENLKTLFESNPSEETLNEKLLEIMPNLNHDQLCNLALYLAFEAKHNDKKVWRTLEDCCLEVLHLYSATQLSQLEWAQTQLKPKHTTGRFNTTLMATIQEKIGECNNDEIMNVLQGFRGKQNKSLYQKIRKILVE